jgi:hypothetical protein
MMGTWRERQAALHQMGLKHPRERDLPFPEVSTWVRDHCNAGRSRCPCGQDLRREEVRGYPHIAGWWTSTGKMWLYIHCPTCGYDVALWKIGVDRDQDFRALPSRDFTERELCELAWAAPDPDRIREISARGRSR